jgi:hypothetical protein
VSVDREAFCRRVEAYLCRKNDGHLIRIVGPAFEQVCGWADRGVPLKVAYHGIDRYFERYYAKGARRRPVRVEFCEADVLDAFDEWRRAVGVPAEPSAAQDAPPRRQASLRAHLDRVIVRATTLRAGADRSLDDVLEAIVRELDLARGPARGLRGDARQRLIARLGELDAELVGAARARAAPDTLTALEREAEGEVAPFRGRLDAAAYARSRDACLDRLVREHFGLPVIAYEPPAP